MFNKTSKYESEVDDSVVSFISSSLGYRSILTRILKGSLSDKDFEKKQSAFGRFFFLHVTVFLSLSFNSHNIVD